MCAYNNASIAVCSIYLVLYTSAKVDCSSINDPILLMTESELFIGTLYAALHSSVC